MTAADVLIVGGGPGGSSCAWTLRNSGLDVVILDKRTFPRDKTCAGWVTPQVFTSLQIDTDDYQRGRVFQPITGFRTGVIGGREVRSQFDEPVSYGIRRCEFDEYLLRRSGARLELGEALKSMQRTDEGWLINDRIEARMLVGAGGHFCPVARSLGAREDKRRIVVAAQEVEFEVDPQLLAQGTIDAHEPELFFCEDLKGYGWCFRKGDFLNIGLGRTDSASVPAHVASFCDFLRERGKVCCDLPPRFKGHAYELYERSEPKLVDEGVLLIGDAAGLAYPQSGEGIRPAVESGMIAAAVIDAARGDYRRANLEPYRTAVTKRLGKPRTGSISDALPAAWLQVLAARLLASKWFAKRVVISNWFLHTDQPTLTDRDLKPMIAAGAR